MDIRDGFATSSKEHLRSLVRVHELDETPFPCTRRIFNPKTLEVPPFDRREPFAPGGHPQARERGGRSQEGDRPPRRKHPHVEKIEDTVGRETMINGAMSSTLMG
jgi:hypothetical protein